MKTIIPSVRRGDRLPQKKTVTSFEADNGFCFDSKDTVRPLSTPLPAADNNYSADEYENKANKVANGDHFVHAYRCGLNLYYWVAA